MWPRPRSTMRGARARASVTGARRLTSSMRSICSWVSSVNRPLAGRAAFATRTSTSAVSATGDGEFFLRAAFAHDVHARMRYQGVPLEDACTHALAEVAALGGKGGCVAVDSAGNLALPFTSAAMFRGWCRPGETPRTGLDAATPTG